MFTISKQRRGKEIKIAFVCLLRMLRLFLPSLGTCQLRLEKEITKRLFWWKRKNEARGSRRAVQPSVQHCSRIMNVEVLALIEISRDQISSSVVQFKQLALDVNSCVYYANLWDYNWNETRKWNAKKIRSKLPRLPHTRALLLHHFFFDFLFEVNSLCLPTRSWMRNLKIFGWLKMMAWGWKRIGKN